MDTSLSYTNDKERRALCGGMITGDFDTPPETFLERIRLSIYVSKVPVVSTDKKMIITKEIGVF